MPLKPETKAAVKEVFGWDPPAMPKSGWADTPELHTIRKALLAKGLERSRKSHHPEPWLSLPDLGPFLKQIVDAARDE